MDPLLQESLALRARYDEEPSHSDQVARLALELYDRLRDWHASPARARELLHSAALLHDIGWSQTPDGAGHHKHSARMIQEHGWKHLPKADVKIVAQIARYHRKALPQPHHEQFHALPERAQRQVMILGGILRLADALDRTHTQKIARATASDDKDALLVRVQTRGPWDAERAMFETKKDMLQSASGRAVRVS